MAEIELRINQCVRCGKIWINGGSNFNKEDLKLIEKLKENEKVKNLLKIRTIVFDSGCPECVDAIGRETVLAMIEQC